MMKAVYLLPVAVLAVAGVMSSVFVVDEREKAVVLQFGLIVDVQEDPGLGFRWPIIQEVVKYDDRILSLETTPFQVTPSDDRRLDVDAFARYRIADVTRFRERFGGEGAPADQIRGAEIQLNSILNVQIREVLGADQVTSGTILSEERRGLMNSIRDLSAIAAEPLGLEVVDVRLVTTNLPEQNREQTFARMEAEREQEAVDERARGQEAAQRIRALAQRTARETVAVAQRDAQIVIGEADAQANATLNAAFGADPEFFSFYQSMLNYETAIQGSNSTLVLTPDSPFFNYFFDPGTGSGLGAIGEGDVEQLLEEVVGDIDMEEGATAPLSVDDLNLAPLEEGAAAPDAEGDAPAEE